jgi:hypothetical protein
MRMCRLQKEWVPVYRGERVSFVIGGRTMKKEIIGVFKARNGIKRKHLVYVSQEISVNRQKVIIGARKIFNLDSLDGEEVRSTADPDIFLMADGTTLRKSGRITDNGI